MKFNSIFKSKVTPKTKEQKLSELKSFIAEYEDWWTKVDKAYDKNIKTINELSYKDADIPRFRTYLSQLFDYVKFVELQETTRVLSVYFKEIKPIFPNLFCNRIFGTKYPLKEGDSKYTIWSGITKSGFALNDLKNIARKYEI